MFDDSYLRKLRASQSRRFRESLSPEDFSRRDESDDALFYWQDRFVAHLDNQALRTVEQVVGKLLTDDDQRVLDLMASWDSHVPPSRNLAQLVGLGLNARELEANDQLTDHVIHDLNRDSTLPFDDGAFDAVLNTVSIDYLTRPVAVLEEVARVLRPGGLLLVTFSNRMFDAKATKLWMCSSEEERVILVEEYIKSTLAFHSPGFFVSRGLPRPQRDKYAGQLPFSDPVYAVWAEKEGGGAPRRPRTIHLASHPRPVLKVSLDEVAESLACGYCGNDLQRLPLYDDWGDAWGGEEIYVCLDDSCPYFVAHWSTNYRSGAPGGSFRFMYDPAQRRCGPLPVSSPRDLKDLVAAPSSS
ncbi:MAG: class I SAM-dependent methyltransferase [Deltaproteobacteria bacterium]|jgi:SAM-dependent methyltransferase|nr:class I SAM-dependent methyltransferase [Deltaproteobacteria bacterium]MBW2534851.1 class I SAM-dependent methyltransferase [Deltaproteobacteria bacterium]